MTLKEAHELQRRELISLRAKVARLEKQTTGLFPVEEKEALERHIRHLEQVNKTESRRHEEARAQKGHKAHTATKLTATKEPVIIPAPDSFASNPDLYPTGKKLPSNLLIFLFL